MDSSRPRCSSGELAEAECFLDDKAATNGFMGRRDSSHGSGNGGKTRKSSTASNKNKWADEPVQIKSTLSPQLQRAVQNLSLVYLTLAQTLNPLMVRGAHKMAKATGRPFLSSTIVLNTEVVKLLMSCFILVLSNGFQRFCSDLTCAFLKNKRETLKVCVPALIYVVQNNLYFFALKRVEATLFSMSYQLRILTTALLSMLLLRRVFSRAQWGALCLSLLGVCLVQLASATSGGGGNSAKKAEAEAKGTTGASDQFLGLVTVFVMCWTSAFAGVYLEGVLKQSSCDIWMQNIRLSVITLPFALLTIANDADQIEKNGLLSGWNWLLWTIVFSSATSGLVVAAVMKYADNIKKSYCQSVALGGTALLSILTGDSQFSLALLGGVSLVIASVFLYTLNPPAKLKPATPEVPLDDDDDDEEEEGHHGLLSDGSSEEEAEEEEERIGANVELKLLVPVAVQNENFADGKASGGDIVAQQNGEAEANGNGTAQTIGRKEAAVKEEEEFILLVAPSLKN